MEEIFLGVQDAFTLANTAVVALGVILGIIVGAIPGLNAPMAIAIAVPLTYSMSPLAALSFLISVNKGGSFGGSISGILLNTPGSPEAAATAIDGYPLAKKGYPVKAMQTALGASVCGDLFSDIVLITVAAPLAVVALKLGPVEICSVIVFAFAMISGLMGSSLNKGLIATALGILFATIGTDPTLSMPRLTFDNIDLISGIPIMAIGIGMLALSEVLLQIETHVRHRQSGTFDAGTIRSLPDDRLTLGQFVSLRRTILRSALIGTFIGALPGLGATISGFLGYGAARRASPNPAAFGKGEIEGVAAAEAANSAVVGANLIPLLTLGIPGNVTSALLVGAFIIHGVAPGPWMFDDHGRLIYGMFAAMIIANFINLAIGGAGLKLFAKVLTIPRPVILPALIFLCLMGAYLNDQSIFAVGLTIAFGILGYLMRKLDYPFVPFIIGFVLTPMLELSLSQAYILTEASFASLIEYPIALAMLALTAVVIGRAIYRGFRTRNTISNDRGMQA
ncbi:MAG: tripartite tricarboxylate transporter permease [Alphaproteobacteria bacterium]|jgi:putative tricarboxylic transport membrane protein|nr:Tricarboxylate transporter family protein [Rhodospirillaceae bacterium]MDP6406829.1 tripartite tricarboxylate transporter permease [Alphaproteobacteria bacterium]MDP6621667.1 tripartite tricarboxylate transporter permease [Alphaproteobacteria bacterium]|tara:strand:+ start:4352 stop:5875 length:1524 start_codon:yes stop_codon:yes gene_type:complete